MVRLVEDEEIDLIHRNEGMHQALIEDLGCTDNDHIFCEHFPPSPLCPKIAAHLTTEALDLLVEITFKYSKLLEDEGHAIHLEVH